MVKVLGHLAPDTDSTCAPIIYAWYLSEHKGMEAKPYITGEINREAQFVLDHFGVDKPEFLDKLEEGDQYALVDTNNPEEVVEGYEDAELLEIVDHHKLVGGLSTESPIKITIRPLACTMTVIWKIMKANGVEELPKEIAGLMLAAILSDTLNFTSPTTTEHDREASTRLAEIAGVNSDDLAMKMFDAKSDLSGMSAKDLLLSDSKKFELGGKKLRVSVLETTKPENSLELKDELYTAMKTLKEEENLDGIFFFAVDILKTEAHLVVSSEFETELAQEAFGKQFDDGVMYLPGVVSRKKQIIPNLEKALN